MTTYDDAIVAEPETSGADGTHKLDKRVRSGALWSAASTLLLKLAAIAITAVVVRIVTPHDFGVFAVALTIFAVVSSFSELGVLSVMTRGDLDADEIGPTVTTVAWVSSAVIASSMYLAAPWLAPALGSAEATDAIRVLSPTVLVIGLLSPAGAMLAREFRQDQIFYANVVSFVPANLLLILLAQRGDGAMAFAWSRLVGVAIAGLYTLWVVDKRYWAGWNRSAARLVLGIGLPLAGANLIGYALLNADYVLVGRRLGAANLGVYLLAFNVANWATSLLATMINSVAVPAFSRLLHDPPRMTRALVRANKLLAVIAWPICGITWVSAQALVLTLYGGQWSASATVLALLAPYGALFVHSLLFANVINGGPGQARILLLIQLLWIAVLVPAMLFGLDRWGVRGVAAAHIVVVIAVVFPAYLFALRKLYGVRAVALARPLLPVLAGALVATAAYVAVAASMPTVQLELFGGAAAALIVYVFAMGPEIGEIVAARGGEARGPVGAVLKIAAAPRSRLSGYEARHVAPPQHRSLRRPRAAPERI